MCDCPDLPTEPVRGEAFRCPKCKNIYFSVPKGDGYEWVSF